MSGFLDLRVIFWCSNYLVFFAKTPLYPGSSLTSLELSLRANPWLKSSVCPPNKTQFSTFRLCIIFSVDKSFHHFALIFWELSLSQTAHPALALHARGWALPGRLFLWHHHWTACTSYFLLSIPFPLPFPFFVSASFSLSSTILLWFLPLFCFLYSQRVEAVLGWEEESWGPALPLAVCLLMGRSLHFLEPQF